MRWILGVLAVAGPAGPGPTDAPQPPARTEQQPAEYTATDAARDVGTILHDTSLEYVRARARLEAHPALATEALTDRLTAVPPPGPAHRKRIFDVLGVLGGAAHLELFADELRRAADQPEDPRNPLSGPKPWRLLILEAGSAARPTLLSLVADAELPLPLRGLLLQDVVEVSHGPDLVALVGLAGDSERTLQRILRRALRARASTDDADRRALLEATDQAMADAALEDLPALINLRVSLQDQTDADFVRAMIELLGRPQVPFACEVSAVRALTASRDHPAARQALVSLARKQLAPSSRTAQRSEVLGWLALSGLSDRAAQSIIAAHDLLGADAPRLAALAYERAPLSNDLGWLAEGLDNPWPQVRKAALGRVGPPCPSRVIDTLGKMAGAVPTGGDPDSAVARSAARSLARCGGPEAFEQLQTVLEDDRAEPARRSQAGRLLVEAFGPPGSDAVAKTLASTPPVALARALIRALLRADPTQPGVKRGLCAATTQSPRVAAPAREALRAIGADPSC